MGNVRHVRLACLLVAIAPLCAWGALGWAAEPQLPAGLAPGEEEPRLPAGLEAPSSPPDAPARPAEPELPPGLVAPPEEARPVEEAGPVLPFEITGFWEVRGGARLRDDEHERDASLGETRLQVQADKDVSGVELRVTADLLLDAVADRHAVDLETGDGFLDLREASLVFSPASMLDVKAGRQILTWGTGDLVFLNDLFPKDWNSFFLGRDEEYLKAPSDAAKVSAFTPWANLDIVYTPRFDADRFIDGRRVSFFDLPGERIVGRDAALQVDRPDEWFVDDEWAARLYRNVASYELTLYGYDGFWKSPAGRQPATGRATFPKLSVYGASVRGPLGRGIANAEVAYYDSGDDRGGGDPDVRNSELRLLLGYEQEIARDLTFGLQYYLERMLGHGAFLGTLPPGAPGRDENRHVLTQRLTWLTMDQNLLWSLSVFVSPSEVDAYLRPRVKYKVSDNLSVEAGGNVFVGRDDHTFFGQFEDNSNVYIGVRYGF